MRPLSRCILFLLLFAPLCATALGGEATVLPPSTVYTFLDVKPKVGEANFTLGGAVGMIEAKFAGRLREIWTRVPTGETEDVNDWTLAMTLLEGVWDAKVGQFADEARAYLKQRRQWQGSFPKSWQGIVKDYGDLLDSVASGDGYLAIVQKGAICYRTAQARKAAKSFKDVMKDFKAFLADTAKVVENADKARVIIAKGELQPRVQRQLADMQLKALRKQLTRMHNWQSAMGAWQTEWRKFFSASGNEPDKVAEAIDAPMRTLEAKIKSLKNVAEAFWTEQQKWWALGRVHTQQYKTDYLQWKVDADPLLNGTVFDAYPFLLGTKNLKDIHKGLDSRVEQWKPLAE